MTTGKALNSVVTQSTFSPGICLEGLKKMANVSVSIAHDLERILTSDPW